MHLNTYQWRHIVIGSFQGWCIFFLRLVRKAAACTQSGTLRWSLIPTHHALSATYPPTPVTSFSMAKLPPGWLVRRRRDGGGKNFRLEPGVVMGQKRLFPRPPPIGMLHTLLRNDPQNGFLLTLVLVWAPVHVSALFLQQQCWLWLCAFSCVFCGMRRVEALKQKWQWKSLSQLCLCTCLSSVVLANAKGRLPVFA